MYEKITFLHRKNESQVFFLYEWNHLENDTIILLITLAKLNRNHQVTQVWAGYWTLQDNFTGTGCLCNGDINKHIFSQGLFTLSTDNL